MAGIRLVVARPTPPAPLGTSYLTDQYGRALFHVGLLVSEAEPYPFGSSQVVDENGAPMADQSGGYLLFQSQYATDDEDIALSEETGKLLLTEVE